MSQPRGVIYVAFGPTYFLQALHSIACLRRHNPTLPVIVLCNAPPPDTIPADLNPQHCSFILCQAPNERNREFKSSVHLHSPFERTLFLDCDTEVKGDLSPGFEFLDHADIAIRPEPAPYAMSVTEQDPAEAERLTHLLGEFNTGVIFFRKSAAATRLLDRWHDHVIRNNKRDQKNFVRAVAECPETIIRPLGAAWNYMRYDVRTHRKHNLLRLDPFVWHYMDYSYAPSALKGVWALSRKIGRGGDLRNLNFIKRQVLRPFLTRYAFLAHVDYIKMVVRRFLTRLTGGSRSR
jgi:hypothetical protein